MRTNHQFFRIKIFKFVDADPDLGSGIRDLVNPGSGTGMEKVGSGIRDKHPGSATLGTGH